MSKKNEVTPIKRTAITVGRGENKQIVSLPTVIKSGGQVARRKNLLDVVFVFDTTGSMDNKIHALLQTCSQFVKEAKDLDLNIQFALISFGDISIVGGSDKIELVVPLTSDIAKMQHGLEYIPRNCGYGNEGETCLEAIEKAFEIPYRNSAVKALILITDEPAVQYHITAESMTGTLSEKGFLVFVISPPENYYKEMASKNGGIWKEISAGTSLNDILQIFKEIAKKVSEIAQEVHLLADGNVKDYLRLKSPQK
jgi:Mg-chelatase subunit ChlD